MHQNVPFNCQSIVLSIFKQIVTVCSENIILTIIEILIQLKCHQF